MFWSSQLCTVPKHFFCHFRSLYLNDENVLLSWTFSTWMEWMSHLVSGIFIKCTSNLNQGNTWKYCTWLPIPITMSFSYKAIIGNRSIIQHRHGPQKLYVWVPKYVFTALCKRRKPVLKGASGNVLSLTILDVSFNTRVESRSPFLLNGVMDCLVKRYCTFLCSAGGAL